MEVFHLNQEGLHRSEKDAINTLSKSLPNSWYGFASLEMFDRQEGSFETDLIILTHDRIIVAELKNWGNGDLHSSNGKWIINRGNYQEDRKHPLKQVSRASKILATKIQKKLSNKVFIPWIDYCVLVCNDTRIEFLPEGEKAFVYTINEFEKVGHPKVYQASFTKIKKIPNNNSERPNKNIDIWKQFFIGNPVDFKPKVFSVNNYIQKGHALFNHANHIYSEYLAERRDDTNYQSLMRKWDFSAQALAEHAQTKEEKKLIGYRESKVLGYISNQEESLKHVYLGLIHIPSPDDIISDFVELYEWPRNKTRLDAFITKNDSRLTPDKRIKLIQVFASQLARLHEIDVAHRDIGKHSVWVSLPSNITFSNFLTASYPDPEQQSVFSVRDIIKSGRVVIPEDLYEDKDGTPFTRDVYLAGAVAHYIAFSTWPEKLDDGTYSWQKNNKILFNGALNSWFERCLDLEAKNRFPNMRFALDQLNILLNKNKEKDISLSELDKFFSDINIYIKYVPILIKQKTLTTNLMQSSNHEYGIILSHGISHLTTDKKPNLELATFLERINSLKNAQLSSTMQVKEFGFNPNMQCLFIVYKWISGKTLDEWIKEDINSNLIIYIAEKLLTGMIQIHRSQFIHGDIHPRNIILSEENNAPIFIDMFEYQNNINASLYNPNYVPPNYENLSLISRDRFALVKIIGELARKSNCLNLEVYCNTLLEQTEISEGDINRFAENFENIVNPPMELGLNQYTILTKYPLTLESLESDGNIYYLSSKVEQTDTLFLLKIFISGTKNQIDIHLDLSNNLIKKIFDKEISHHQFINNKRRSEIELEGSIILSKDISNSADELIKTILSTPQIQEKIKNNLKGHEFDLNISTGKGNTSFAPSKFITKTSNIWKALVETENETFPKITITKEIEYLPNGDVLIYFTKNNTDIDFDLSQEKVQLRIDRNGSSKFVGHLLDFGKNTLKIKGISSRLKINVGDILRLEGSLSSASLAKRQKAIDNILDGSAIIPDIVDYFDINKHVSPQTFASEPTEEELDLYTITDQDGNIIFNLNEQQRKAFKYIYQYGPIGLLQGPPGTGKTAFISSFIHFIVSKGASRILLVSQSHEAVNNAAEKVRKIFEKQKKDIQIVRLGDEGNISGPLMDVHELALQNDYRELFRAEFKNRVKSVANTLGLDSKFVDIAIEFESSFGIKITSFSRAILTTDKETSALLISKSKKLLEKLNRWLSFKNIPEIDFEQYDLSDIKNVFYSVIFSQYEVYSPDLISRFQDIINLSTEWLEVMSSRNAHFQNFLTKTRTLVCGTCVGIGRNHYGMIENIYDWVIIDEAARSTASEMAIAMQVGRRVLLVGDHKQLPPTYEDEHLVAAHRKLSDIDLNELKRSDFERSFYSYYGLQIGQTLLTQYRMVEPIGELISECFYDKKLKTGRNDINIIYKNLPSKLGKTITWIDTSNAKHIAYEKKPNYFNADDNSLINEYETNTIINLIQQLLCEAPLNKHLTALGADDSPIGVICMYAEQRRFLIRKLNSLPWARTLLDSRFIKVDTVDSYQGKENEIVILSLVRFNNKFKEGFLTSKNRANVALSRAKERLYIVGASIMWSDNNKDSIFGEVLEYIKRNSNNCDLLDSNQINERSE